MADVYVDDLIKPFLYAASTALENLNFYEQVVESDDDPNNVASSEATFVFSGPPVLKRSYTTYYAPDGTQKNNPYAAKLLPSLLKPIGAVQQINVQAGKQIIPFRELGSKLLRQAAGSTQYSGSMSRVLTRQNNLKYAFYRWLFEGLIGKDDKLNLARVPSDNNKQFIGLESEVYNIPFGLLILVGSAGGKVIQAEYLEKCHIASDGSSKQVGNTLIVDNVQFTVSRSIPFVHNVGAATTKISTDTNVLRSKGTDGSQIGMFGFSATDSIGEVDPV